MGKAGRFLQVARYRLPHLNHRLTGTVHTKELKANRTQVNKESRRHRTREHSISPGGQREAENEGHSYIPPWNLFYMES